MRTIGTDQNSSLYEIIYTQMNAIISLSKIITKYNSFSEINKQRVFLFIFKYQNIEINVYFPNNDILKL